ncbi:spermidine/putrescine ABC transporter permease PotC [Pelagibaculum spongiae]|uniref:Spermidine/putrescine transport system permease protein PotC n=1 Tax=Pelagibaculum spongiae TaxID=2080658 RepID=A0A2V1GRG0_9GAMM|nr:spermidine/putrescine ABC transporter permease PotC [Pelagibaculum spongiae]PVZ62946.1 spermidine/putrescine ABC transporter permease PotC [Pelagibaculum spongiae]
MIKQLQKTYLAIIYLLLYIPIGVLIVHSFNQSRYSHRWGGLSFKWYEKLLGNETLLNAAYNSIVVAFVSATLAVIIGSLIASALHRYQFRGKKIAGGLLFVLMMSPDIVLAISLLILFLMLGIQLGFISLLLAHITFCLPYAVITIYSRLSTMDNQLLEAAKDLGASELQSLIKIVLPLVLPSLISAWLLSFTLSLDDVIVSSFVTGPSYEILPLRVYSMVRLGVTPEVNALATIMLLSSLVLVVLSQWISRKSLS